MVRVPKAIAELTKKPSDGDVNSLCFCGELQQQV